ncbi:hypothetical protein [Aridibaculum aurantiacum]|uniref:hypothetical protein n=1 Tax=Aridibaculum aurantiacum TaxID=2810307 RepID=UPI001A977965|nr:hypothetical protein [Aridibaculum aurantiacum]
MQTYSNLYAKNPGVVSFGSTEIGPYYWVGHCKNGIDYYAGQTFKAPADGMLTRIKLFPSVVYGSTEATLSLYEFDMQNHTWIRKCTEIEKPVRKVMEGQWISFDISGMIVNKNSSYGFKISCNGDGMLAIAECPWNISNPYPDGEEWIGSSQKMEGNFHKDFDLAFEGSIEP